MNVSKSDMEKLRRIFASLGFNQSKYLEKNRDLQKFIGDEDTIIHHYLAHGFSEGRVLPVDKPELAPQTLDQSELPQEMRDILLSGIEAWYKGLPVSAMETRNVDHESELRLLRHKHRGSQWLTPTDLSVTNTPLRRVLVLGSCNAASWDLPSRNMSGTPVDFLLVNHVANLGEPPQPAENYDLQLVQIPLRSSVQDNFLWSLPHADVAAHERAFSEACDHLAFYLDSMMAWNVRYGMLTFVANFLVPQQNPAGRLMPRYDLRNPAYFVEQLNAKLESLLRKYKNIYLLDIDKIAAALGRRHIQDDGFAHIAHNALQGYGDARQDRIEPLAAVSDHFDVNWAPDFTDAIWAEMVAMYRTVRQIDPVKMVVVDLDDTLWNGVSGESSDIDPDMIEGWPLGVVEALAYLKQRGVLLGIISKNDENRIRTIWNKIFRQKLKLEDFAVVKINWQPKADNMREMLQQVNLLPRNVVFIDDNPVERAAMKFAYPDMRILGKYPYYLRRILLWAPETQVASISAESGRRTEMIKAQVERDTQKTQLSRDAFLASLDLKIKVFEIASTDNAKFARAFELLNKTNQFNTTGRRWKHEECTALFAGGGLFYAFDVTDRFSSYGLVGVVIVDGGTIVQFVMSCRVVGLDVEAAVLSTVIGRMRARGASNVVAHFVRTDANLLCVDLYAKAGFVAQGDAWLFGMEAEKAVPAFIEVD